MWFKKIARGRPMASDESWKEKYLQEVEFADDRDRQWKEERNVLERMLVRTSLASEGQTPELDKLLAQLRKDIRGHKIDLNAWRKLQEQIDHQVAHLDELSAGVPTGAARAESEPEAGPEPKTEAESVSEPEPALVTGPAGIKSHEQDLASNNQRLRIARRVGQLLGHVIDQISLEPEAEASARALQQALLVSDDWDELREGLTHVAELVIAAVTQSKREFESFLKRLDERLDVLRQHFADQSVAQSGRISATDSLNQQIQSELEQVSLHLQASDDIGQLRQSVSRHLASIGQAVDHFRIEETEREKLLNEQLVAMQEKLTAMETHSEHMQEQIQRERVRAMTDLLTQLPNREAWQERLSFEFNRWQRYQYPLTIGVLDLDLFKRINDTYGHKAGDRVLQLVAKELRERLRSTDFVARYGGEEFVLLLPETRPEDAQLAMDNIREHVSKLPFHFSGNPVTITFSAGLAAFTSEDSEDSVFERADKAVYLAKMAGRNCVRISGDSPGA